MKILVVEDKDSFRSAAEQYFIQRTDVQVDYAKDYDEAMESLLKGEYDGALVDCFFPKKRGSNDISLGMEACDKLEEKINETLNEILLEDRNNDGKYRYNFKRDLIAMSFHRRGIRLGQEQSVKAYVGLIRKKMSYDDYYEEDRITEDMQPLGILVAEEIKKKGIPFLLTTNEYHHGLMSDIICVYQRLRDWPEIEDGYDYDYDSGEGKYYTKDEITFWKVAYTSLEKFLSQSPPISNVT